ncbi:DUF202 domain-containing protein [Micromonospora sp. WMMD1076]|uniref:DUF202 domain-containing protein n=1 Tax=Micromonospora sp. WMMD1076 TaxID=3016103 RepID=UPI00249B402B|nr:DUF202 domain-containing protein [Micromonospora sp. WMMD1076]WFF05910.1 DUF202 domain-containing protein [Micromonospora sp. WMMD1076]
MDVRFLPTDERTLLAWLRTALTMPAGGVALLHPSDLPASGRGAVPATAGVVVIATAIVAVHLTDLG